MAAYTFRSAGTWGYSTAAMSPGAPAGRSSGDLLLIATASRTSLETPNVPTGWTLLYDGSSVANRSIALLGRIADGTATDVPNLFDFWTGLQESVAQIASFYGNVWAGGLSTIVSDSAALGASTAITDIPSAGLSVSTADCLIVAIGKKHKTSNTDGATLTSPSGLTNRIGFKWDAGSACGCVWDYVQQSTPTNITSGIWDISIDDTAEPRAASSIIVALKTIAPGSTPALMGQAVF